MKEWKGQRRKHRVFPRDSPGGRLQPLSGDKTDPGATVQLISLPTPPPSPVPHPPWTRLFAPRKIMTKDYDQLWKGVTLTTGEAQAVLALAEILADKEGRAFVSRLGGGDARLCIEILDDVSHDCIVPFRHLIKSR